MTDEKKKEFQRRLSQCNSSMMIVIQYEIFFEFLKEAEQQAELGGADFRESVNRADAVLQRLMGSLDFNYDISKELFPLYNYCRQQLAIGRGTHKLKAFNNARNVMKKLYDAFEKIASEDNSPPVMGHTQKVFSGLTYGKDSLNEGIDVAAENRGFLA